MLHNPVMDMIGVCVCDVIITHMNMMKMFVHMFRAVFMIGEWSLSRTLSIISLFIRGNKLWMAAAAM